MARKRGNGEGAIQKRADGRYVARLTMSDGTRKNLYAKTRAEAERKLTAAKVARDTGLPVLDHSKTVGKYLAEWLETDARPTVRPGTYAAYASHVRTHLVPRLGHLRLLDLQPSHVQSMQTELLDAGLTPTTVHRVRATLRRALNRAVRLGLLGRNVATLVDPPRAVRYPVQVLGPDEAQDILAAFQDHALGPLVTLALATGLRQGELLGLRWQDVNLDARSLTVTCALQRGPNGPFLAEPKSEKCRRTVKLRSLALEALRQRRASQNRDRLAAGDEWRDQWGLVFTTRLGTPLDGTNVTHRFQAHLAESGLPTMRFHDLRHGCATLMLRGGEQPKVVADQLGHSSITLTMNTYAHVLPASLDEAADRLDAMLTERRRTG
jgi:integrase